MHPFAEGSEAEGEISTADAEGRSGEGIRMMESLAQNQYSRTRGIEVTFQQVYWWKLSKKVRLLALLDSRWIRSLVSTSGHATAYFHSDMNIV